MLIAQLNKQQPGHGFTHSKKFHFFIVIWLLATTIILILNSHTLTTAALAESVALTVVACYLIYFPIKYLEIKKLSYVTDLIIITCLSFLLLIFEHWGLVYMLFMALIVISDAFVFTTRHFMVLLVCSTLAPFYFWVQMDSMIDHTVVEKTLYFTVPFAIFAVGMIFRVIAAESLDVQVQKNNLELSIKRLKREQEEMTAVLNGMDSALISLDENNEIYFYNTSAKNIFPILMVIEQASGRIPLDSLQLIDSSGRPISLKEIVDNSTRVPYRVDLNSTVDGKSVKLNILATKIYGETKNYLGAMISIHNLTAEEIIEQSKIEFAALASHEIRTPLTVIVGFLNMMLNSPEFEYNDHTKEYLERLHNSTSGLVKLANDILTMSTVDQGAVRVNIEEINLADLIMSIVAEQRKLAEQKGLGIDYTINKVPAIETDQVKVHQILEQLIGNAIKFSNSGMIDVQLDIIGDEITLSVEDAGIGVSTESQDKLFNKFSQVEDWKTHSKSGSGLGLYVAKSLAKRIGGDLVYAETTKKGSKFSLILPKKYPFPEDLRMRESQEMKEFIKGF